MEAEMLTQYGVLGLWTLSLIVEKYKYHTAMRQAINNNTTVLNRNCSVLELIRQKLK